MLCLLVLAWVLLLTISRLVSREATSATVDLAVSGILVGLVVGVVRVLSHQPHVVVVDRERGWIRYGRRATCSLDRVKHVSVGRSASGGVRVAAIATGERGGKVACVLCETGRDRDLAAGIGAEVAAFLGVECRRWRGLVRAKERTAQRMFEGHVSRAGDGQWPGLGPIESACLALSGDDALGRELAAQVLLAVGDVDQAARTVLCAKLVPRERMEALTALARVARRPAREQLRAIAADVPALCQRVLAEPSTEEEHADARAMLAHIAGLTLLRPASAPPEEVGKLLLRPASGPPQTPTEQLLRPADSPERR